MTNKRIHMLSIEKEKLVIDLYYNQRKNVRQIAQEARISFRDISAIIKKKEADRLSMVMVVEMETE